MTQNNLQDFQQRAQSTEMLDIRLSMNRALQKKDMTAWLFDRLKVKAGDKVLDVACGTGNQTNEFIRLVGKDGIVCAFDISEESINKLRNAHRNAHNIFLSVADMDDIEKTVQESFPIQNFDIIQCAYAIYYAEDPESVLRSMTHFLNDSGKLAIFVPLHPNGMVEYVRNFHRIPEDVDYSLSIGQKILEPYFRNTFEEIEVHFFKNILRITSSAEFMTLYQSTTYYSRNHHNHIEESLFQYFKNHDSLDLEKNGYLIIGRKS